MLSSLKSKGKSFPKRKPAWLQKKSYGHMPRRLTRAEYIEKMTALCGSIDDETFIRQPQVMTLENIMA